MKTEEEKRKECCNKAGRKGKQLWTVGKNFFGFDQPEQNILLKWYKFGNFYAIVSYELAD